MSTTETDEERAAREATEQAAAQQAATEAATAKADKKSPERKAAEAHAKEMRKRATEAAKDPALGPADRAAHEMTAIHAELAVNPRDEFTDHPPVYIINGEKRGPNGRAIGKDGREEPGPIEVWMPASG